jgi:hypothetical protein
MESDYRDLSMTERVFGKPLTPVGWWSLACAAAFGLLLWMMGLWGSRPSDSRTGLFDDPVGASLVAATASCGIASGVLSALGFFWKHERSALLFATLLLGLLVALFACGEFLEGAGRQWVLDWRRGSD